MTLAPECEACDDTNVVLCDGCGCCQGCCNCTDTDCDCDACAERRDEADYQVTYDLWNKER